jgi:hypothetical protein
MSTPPADDASHARFRRGASHAPAGQAAPPPPVVPGYGVPAYAGPVDSAAPMPFQPGSAAPSPESLWGPPGGEAGGQTPVPAAPETFVVNGFGQPGPSQQPYGQAAPLYETPSYEWMPVEADPGRGSGITSIAVGIFFGLIGLFIGIHSVRRSRSVGLKGAVGIVGIVVSSLSMLLFGSIVGSWIKYEVDLAAQCSQVDAGQYYTSSGHVVTCPA